MKSVFEAWRRRGASLVLISGALLSMLGSGPVEAGETDVWTALESDGNGWNEFEATGWIEEAPGDPIDRLATPSESQLAVPPTMDTWVADSGAGSSPSSGTMASNSGGDSNRGSYAGSGENMPGVPQTSSAAKASGAAEESRLGLTLTSAWSSKWMWRGYNIFDNPMYGNALQAKLWNTGFKLTVANLGTAADRGDSIIGKDVPDWIEDALPGFKHRDFDANLYRADWEGSICDQLTVSLGAQYYDFYRISSSRLDYMEAFGVFTLSKMPLSPHVGFFYGWPYGSARQGEGWMVDYGLTHFHPFQDLSFCCFKPVGVLLKADLWYNGGAWAPFRAPGWSHATFTGAIPIALSEKLSLTPMLNYQYSIEDRVDRDNEWYTTVALQYKW
ncbi:MAG: hypothetical protein KC944_11065 [Candidatus Omnitrophica bacterium]|nr:hypothetical protein [Candidatus Omnitrophota bacterium]